jgi:hypothetical protein
MDSNKKRNVDAIVDNVEKENGPLPENKSSDVVNTPQILGIGDVKIEVNKDEDNDDISVKIHKKEDGILPEASTLSVDRSGSMLMPKMSVMTKDEPNYLANLNTLKTLSKKEKEEKEKEEEKQDMENVNRKFSEASHVSNLSAHKIVLRNGQKDLVCFTNEHRSEPDNDMFRGELPQNLSNDVVIEEEKLSARDVASESANESSEDESKDIVNDLKPIIKIENVYKGESGADNISNSSSMNEPRRDSNNVKKLSIKNKKRMSDFDEVTQGVQFKVYKQDMMQRDTKVQITDHSIVQSKSNITDLSIKNEKKEDSNKNEEFERKMKKKSSMKKVN